MPSERQGVRAESAKLLYMAEKHGVLRYSCAFLINIPYFYPDALTALLKWLLRHELGRQGRSRLLRRRPDRPDRLAQRHHSSPPD